MRRSMTARLRWLHLFLSDPIMRRCRTDLEEKQEPRRVSFTRRMASKKGLHHATRIEK